MIGLLDHWQTLIAGFIAFIGAIATVWVLLAQAHAERARKSRAARALMPAALASVGDYARACILWLQDAIEPARRAERHDYFVGDNEQAAEAFEPLIAQIFLDAVAMYERLGRNVGWTAPPVNERSLNEMQRRTAKAKERRKREAEAPNSDLI